MITRPLVSPTTPAIARAKKAAAGYPADAFVTTWQTTSSPESITLPLYNTGTFNCTVDWGDGNTSTITAYDDVDRVHEYATAGTYTVVITGTLPGWRFVGGGDCAKVRTIEQWGDVGFEDLYGAFQGCTGITSIAGGVLAGTYTNLTYAFRGLTSLTSFPALDVSPATTLKQCWEDCTAMTSFGAITVRSAGVSLERAWDGCTALTSFPALTLGTITSLSATWRDCTSLTSFPALDLSGLTGSAANALQNCNQIASLPAIDLSGATSLSSTFRQLDGLTTFPSVTLPSGAVSHNENFYDIPNVTTFPALTIVASSLTGAFRDCIGLTSIDASNWDTSSSTSFNGMFFGCVNLGALPSNTYMDTSSGTDFRSFARGCTSITTLPNYGVSGASSFLEFCFGCSSLASVPSGLFDSVTATVYTSIFSGSSLTETSVDNILVSLDTSGVTNSSIDLSTGTCEPPSATGLAAKASLEGKGWTVTVAT